MTRKDYIATAAILARYRMLLPTDTWVAMMNDFAIMFKRDNENFDFGRFREACYK